MSSLRLCWIASKSFEDVKITVSSAQVIILITERLVDVIKMDQFFLQMAHNFPMPQAIGSFAWVFYIFIYSTSVFSSCFCKTLDHNHFN